MKGDNNQRCDKEGYASRQQAIDAIKGLAAKHHQAYTTYFCTGCSTWHITSTVKNKKMKPLKEWKRREVIHKSFVYPAINKNIKKIAVNPPALSQGKVMTAEQAALLKKKLNLS